MIWDFYTLERAENVFFSAQVFWVLCPVHTQERTTFMCFQSLAQGGLSSQEENNGIYKTYKADKEKNTWGRALQKAGKLTSSVKLLLLLLHRSLAICVFLSIESFEAVQGPIEQHSFEDYFLRLKRSPIKHCLRLPLLLASVLLHQYHATLCYCTLAIL